MFKVKTKTHELIEARIRAGYSQRGLGRALEPKTSNGYICQIESGERDPSPEMARRICKALSAEFDELFTIIKVEQSETPEPVYFV